jgi:hypothetical protein
LTILGLAIAPAGAWAADVAAIDVDRQTRSEIRNPEVDEWQNLVEIIADSHGGMINLGSELDFHRGPVNSPTISLEVSRTDDLVHLSWGSECDETRKFSVLRGEIGGGARSIVPVPGMSELIDQAVDLPGGEGNYFYLVVPSTLETLGAPQAEPPRTDVAPEVADSCPCDSWSSPINAVRLR